MTTTVPSAGVRSWHAWLPLPPTIDRREALRIAVGATLGLFVAGGLCLVAGLGHVWLVAPLGASAVLVFGLPSSPLAQPWAVIAGNTLSALVGIAVMHVLPWPLPAAALAVGLAIAAMVALRCLHPPGGAVALLTVLVGASDWRFAFFPVFANSLLLVAAGVVYNRATGRSYPHVSHPPPVPARRFSDADIDAVLARHNMLMHTPRDEFEELLEEAEVQSHGRRLRELRCQDIMSRAPVTAEASTPLPAAWAILRQHDIKALPVIDAMRRVVGIVTQADFMRDARIDVLEGPDGRPRWQVRSALTPGTGGPAVVGQIMSRRVRVASADRSLADIVPIFSETGHHHIPVIGVDGTLVGVLTQTDVVRALRRFADPVPAAPATVPAR
jgi:CBS domain-containing membrane protein